MGVRRIEDLMRIARSVEAIKGQEAGHGWQHQGPTQIRFPEEEGSDIKAARIAEQILAKLGPESQQSRDPKRRPPTAGSQQVRSVEREASPPASKDTSKNKSADKAVERNRERSPSTDRSMSRNREDPPLCYKCKGYGHFLWDSPSSVFYTVGPNGLPVKKRERPRCGTAFKLSQGRAGSPRRDPPPRHPLPEWGSTDVEGDLVKKEENQKQTIATKETKLTRPQAAIQTPGSDIRTMDKQSDLGTTPLPVANKHHRGWLIPITINEISTLALLDTGATCTMIGRPLYETLQAVQPLKVKQDADLRIEVIRGSAAPTLGTATVQIGIVESSYKHEVVISANQENANCILGYDFFCQHDYELSMQRQQFWVGD